jgi:hypothetical protein
MTKRKRRRAVLLFVALSLAGIGTAVAIYWKELRLEW